MHCIYALVHDESQWPNLLSTMDEFFAGNNQIATPNELPEHISSLLPHVERANLLLEKISELHVKSKHSDKILNHLPMGIVLTDTDAKILSLNIRARMLLDYTQTQHREGTLHFRNKAHQESFARALRDVGAGKSSGAPVCMGDLNLWISHYGSGTSTQLAVYLGHQTFQRHICIEQLINVYGLTKKEAQLTAFLCDGHASLEEAAESMGINTSTARTHLKKIFSKTGAQRQADLIKMALVNPILALQQWVPGRANEARQTNATLFAHLPSGRTISYAEYGDPKGSPVLFCHAITGNRLMLPSDTSPLTGTGMRLIVPDRAGYGFSTPASGDCMQQWLEDMRHFLPLLNAGPCCVIGYSAGGAHAMALAAANPEMVHQICLISSVAPLRQMRDTQHLQPISRMVIHLARNNPDAAREFLKLSLQVALKKPDSYFNLATNSLPDLDHEVLGDAGLQQHLLDAFAETTRQGIEHLINEMMYLSTAWRINASQIICPVNIWHGTDDMHAPFRLMEIFSKKFQQGVSTNWMQGAGHYMLFKHWPEIINELRKKGGMLSACLPGLALPTQMTEWLQLLTAC